MSDQNTTNRPPPTPQSLTVAHAVRGLWVLSSPDPATIGTVLPLHGLDEAILGRASDATFPLADQWLSRRHLRLAKQAPMSDNDSQTDWVAHDLGASNGTSINGTPLTSRALCDGDLLRLGGTVLCFNEGIRCPDDLGLTGLSVATQRVREQVHRLRVGASAVYVSGAPGSGKEVVARALHSASERKGKHVCINMATLVAGLAESQLFGHRKGAFSGATTDQRGAFDTAAGGTLVLDEIAELPAELQAKLLRAVQFQEIQRIGDSLPHTVDVQIVVTTHQNLNQLVADGSFREDLYWRLAGARIALQPLRSRVLDVVPLLTTFLRDNDGATLQELVAMDSQLAYHAASIIERAALHPWPGNARELRDEAHHLGRIIKLRMITSPQAPLPPLHEAFTDRLLASEPKSAANEVSPPASREVAALPLNKSELEAIFNDSTALQAAIDRYADGNVRLFSARSGLVLGTRADSVRRRVYRRLHPA